MPELRVVADCCPIDKNMDDELRSAVLRFVHDMGIIHGKIEAVSFAGSDSETVDPTVD